MVGRPAKKNELTAELSFYYGFDATRLSDAERAGFAANLPKMQARRIIERGQIDDEDFKGIYDLYMLAFNDEQLARKKQTEAAWRVVRSEQRTAAT